MAPQHLKRPRPKRCGRPAYCRAWPRTGNPYAKLTSFSHFSKDSRMPPIAGPEYDTISASVNKAAAIAKSALLIPAEMPSLKGSHHHELPELRKRICRRREILRILRRAVGFRGKRTRRPVPPAPASPFNAPKPSMPVGTNAAQSSAPQAPAQTQSGYAPYEPPAQPYGTQNGYAVPNANTQQGYYAQPGPSQQNPYQNAYQAPYGQPAYQGAYDGAIYPMSDSDRTLRLINFILCLVSTITCALLIIPLAWMLPMTIISWGIYKGKKRNTTAFGVCTLLFVNLIGGILLLCSHKDQ